MRKRVHVQIALVGGQPTPVYQGIVQMQADQVVLVCSSQTKKIAKHIRQELPSYSDHNVMIYQVSDNDIESMYKDIETIEQALPKGITLSLNVTGGMKLWSVIFYTIFKRKRRSCRTFFIGQDGTFFDMKERATKGHVDFDMDAQFKILGHQLEEYMPLTEYTPEDFDVLEQVTALGFNQNKHLFKITEQFVNEYKQIHGDVQYEFDYDVSYNSNRLEWHAETHTFNLLLGSQSFTFTSQHVANILLNTAWFELYVARLIAQIYGAENIRMNCIFRNRQNLPKNEIDIIVNTGSKLIFVECKTQIFHTTDVDKFQSAVRNYGGLGSKPLFITYWQMKPEGLEKCNDHRITTFHINNPKYKEEKDCVDALRDVLDNLNKTWNV